MVAVGARGGDQGQLSAGVISSKVVSPIQIHARRRGGEFTMAGVVGRVGALAVALGVGSAVAAMPVAFADTRGSAGSSGSGVSDPSSGSSSVSSAAPVRRTSRAQGAVPVRGAAESPASANNDSPSPVRDRRAIRE